MGVIKRQSIKQSIVTYVGMAIGAFSTFFIYSQVLNEYGFIQVLINAASLSAPFVFLGMPLVGVRFFPEFKDEEKDHNGLLFLLLGVTIIGFICFVLFFLSFESMILEHFSKKKNSEWVIQFLPYVIPLTFCLTISTLLTQYISNFHRIVVPSIVTNLLPKVALPVLILLYIKKIISLAFLVNVLLVVYVASMLCLFLYLHHLGHLHLRPQFSFLKKERLKRIWDYAKYGVLSVWGQVLANRIDIVMVASLTENWAESTTVYAVAFFFSEVIDTPRKAIQNISSPIVSEAWKRNDLAHINDLYKKTSLNQLIAGLFIFIGIWVSIDDLYSIMPNGDILADGKIVVLVLAMTKLIDMITGINNWIIGHSKYFRFNFYAIIFLAFFNIVNNVLLIPTYLITGAAIATFLSVTVYNILKSSYVWYRFKMQPFTWQTVWVILIGLVTYGCIWFIPESGYVLLDILIRSIVVTIVYGSAILYFKISPDINDTVFSVLGKIKAYF